MRCTCSIEKTRRKNHLASCKLAQKLDVQYVAPGTAKTWPAVRGPEPTRSVVRTSNDQRLVAAMCPYPDCGETFPLKTKGDWGSYNLAGFDRHLAEVHQFVRPKPVEVWGF